MSKTGCVAAHKIPQGGCFIKRTGTFAYMRISEWALKHLGVDPHGEVIGVSYNGNVTRVKPGTLVRPVGHEVLKENAEADVEWAKVIGATGMLGKKAVFVREVMVQEQTLAGSTEKHRYLQIDVDKLGFDTDDRIRVVVEPIGDGK